MEVRNRDQGKSSKKKKANSPFKEGATFITPSLKLLRRTSR